MDSKCRKHVSFELLENDYFRLSPDGRYLAALVGDPELIGGSEQKSEVVSRRILPSSKLYDLQSCSEVNIAEHLALRLTSVGEFSADSRYYLLQNVSFYIGNRVALGAIKFDLQTGKIVDQIPERMRD